ncbi:Ger(x)C family spore germination protein [Alicyclobacillus fastidiosus]|uniref:Ger(X)C family spore germination protein n=1 Tax=Alicyclobacillus fastidiosus TaxID=392011 RepID=A0ABV5AC50_9BACL|nr:Ger(x)C family spore germination protein [Alicyclobacillus fastidiosus]WEH11445.1 Ger(x)C family spore germination protein [Alicyclobacillus fastidiosus]
MNARALCCAAVLALSTLCTGCWDATEIDRLAIVSASGLDLVQPDPDSPPLVQGTLQIARASEMGSNGGGSPTTTTGSTDAFILEQAKGQNALQPFDIIRKRLSRKLFLGQRRVIVIGEDYAKHGVYDLVDEVIRNPQSRLRTYVVIAYHSTAESILKLPYALNRLPSDAIAEIEQQGSVPEVDAKDFIEKLVSKGDTFAMGIDPVQSAPEGSDASASTFQLNQIAIFRGDKLVGWLEGPTFEGFLWIYGRMKRADTTVRLPGVPGYLTGRMLSIRTERSVAVVNGRPQININTRTQYDIAENGTPMNLNDPSSVNKVRDAIQQEILSQMKSTMDALQQKYVSDPFGFGEQLDKQYPRAWAKVKENWHSTYSKTPVVITADVEIRNSGLTGPPLRKPPERQPSTGGQD